MISLSRSLESNGCLRVYLCSMTVADETFPVRQYDLIFCGVGEGRGIYNSGTEPLEIFKVSLP
jgi:mannose-6-phosphate isomerase-like protein (cupin superfamily)